MRLGWLLVLTLTMGCNAVVPAPSEEESALTKGGGGGGTIDPPPAPPPVECTTNLLCQVPYSINGVCHTRAAANGTACGGDACHVASVCSNGACVAGAPRSCDDGNPCTDDSCDVARGCLHQNNTASCNDSNACTMASQCRAGVCVGLGPTTGVLGPATLLGLSASAPPPGDVIFRPAPSAAPIAYLQGGELDLAVKLPACAWVTGVAVNGDALTGAARTDCDDVGPYDCEPDWYSLGTDVINPDGTHTLTVQVHVVNPGDGGTSQVTLTTASALGAINQTILVVNAGAVNRAAKSAAFPVTISESELRNTYVEQLLAEYLGRGSDDPRTAVYFNAPLTIDATGITVGVQYDLMIGGCPFSASVNGHFHLALDPNGLATVVWDQGPTAGAGAAAGCFFYGAIDPAVEAKIQSEFSSSVTTAFQTNMSLLTAGKSGLLDHFSSAPGQLTIWMKRSCDGFSFDLPYWQDEVRAPGVAGSWFHQGDVLTVAASGLAHTCVNDSSNITSCTAASLGPDGVFDWKVPYGTNGVSNSVPIADPWNLSSYNSPQDQQRALNALVGVSRDPNGLPRGDVNPGELLAAETAGVSALGNLTQAFTTQGEGAVGFGPNESQTVFLASPLSGSFHLDIGFGIYPAACR
jgi:hypothetical protein